MSKRSEIRFAFLIGIVTDPAVLEQIIRSTQSESAVLEEVATKLIGLLSRILDNAESAVEGNTDILTEERQSIQEAFVYGEYFSTKMMLDYYQECLEKGNEQQRELLEELIVDREQELKDILELISAFSDIE